MDIIQVRNGKLYYVVNNRLHKCKRHLDELLITDKLLSCVSHLNKVILSPYHGGGGSCPKTFTDALVLLAFPCGDVYAWLTQIPSRNVTLAAVGSACIGDGRPWDRRYKFDSAARSELSRNLTVQMGHQPIFSAPDAFLINNCVHSF